MDRGDLFERILRWEVWYRTPWGFCSKLSDANEKMEEADLDPDITIIPVCVAISETTHEVMER